MSSSRGDQRWFDCKTLQKPYDEMVKMSKMALKHHLGDTITLNSKGNWAYHWGSGYEMSDGTAKRAPGGAVEVCEHVFPERAPVRNILSSESVGWQVI